MSSEPNITMKPAVSSDADRLTEIVQTCFPMAPEWRAPGWIIRRWWLGLMGRDDCRVICLRVDGVHHGFIIYVADEPTWDRIETSGPNNKLVKLYVMLTNRSVRRSRLAKRKRLREARAQTTETESAQAQSPRREEDWHNAEFFAALMAIDPSCRSKGLGTMMLQECERLAKERGSDLVRIYADPRNVRAHALYERLGYRHAGRSRNSLVMLKNLQT